MEHLNTDLGVETLARLVHMSPRNFARVYAQTRGRTPAKAVEPIRIDVARRRLEETTDRIETVAERSGFTGEEQMRTAFVRSLGIPPREYRKRFASTARRHVDLPSHVHLAYPQPTGSHVLNAHAQQDAAVAKGLAN